MEPVARLDVESPDCSPVEKFCSLWSPRAARNCLDNISTRKDEVSEDEYQQFVFATALRIDDLPLARSCVEKDDHFLSKLHTRWGGDMSAKTALFYPCHILAAHHGGARLLEYLLTVTAGTSPVNKSMRSMLLRFAARWGRVDIVKFLYDFQKEEAPWDLDDWRSKDCQDLQEAQKTSSLQVLNFVQDKLLRSFPSFGRRLKLETPLVTAARQNRLDTIAHIIRREPAIGGRCCLMGCHPNHARNVPLQDASKAGNVAVAEYLIQHGADPDLAIPPAAEYGRIEFVKAMLEAGRAIGNGLAKAAAGGYWDIVRLLLDAGADVNASTGKDSPLAHAISREHTTMVKLLLDRGAELKLDGTAQECLRRAKKDGLDSMLALLEESGVDTRESA